MSVLRWLKHRFMDLLVFDTQTQLEYLDKQLMDLDGSHLLMLHGNSKLITFVTLGKASDREAMASLIDSIEFMHSARAARAAVQEHVLAQEKAMKETKEQTNG